MRILIIEDEQLAAEYLSKLITEIDDTIIITEILDSVASSVQWLLENPLPDLIFMDIHLADGISFEIFGKINIDCSVIFTTAYEEYALKAFKVNSVDYLLKPININELSKALNKFKEKHYYPKQNVLEKSKLDKIITMLQHNYKNRYTVKAGLHIRIIPVEEIEFFFSNEKSTYIAHCSGKEHLIDLSLDQIEEQIDPASFFRVNRKYIVNLDYIKDIISLSNSTLQIKTQHFANDDITVSRNRLAGFKTWIEA